MAKAWGAWSYVAVAAMLAIGCGANPVELPVGSPLPDAAADSTPDIPVVDAGLLKCLPSATRCDGNTVVECNADGTAETVIEKCEPQTKCAGGACQSLCDLTANSTRSCLFYAVDLDQPDARDLDPFTIVLINPDSINIAKTVVERRVGIDWNTVATGELLPEDSIFFEFDEDTHQEVTGVSAGAAYRVNSTVPVFAFQWNATSASALSPRQGVTGLGWSGYYALTMPGAGDDARSEATVVATEDGSTVTVSLRTDIPDLGLVAGESESWALNEGDVLLVASETGDLSGSYFDSASIVAFSHHENLDGDAIEEQFLPWSGYTFFAEPRPDLDCEAQKWRILGAYDGTTVETAAGTFAINQGDVVDISVCDEPSGFSGISDGNIFVAHITEDASGAAMTMVYPVYAWLGQLAFEVPAAATAMGTIARCNTSYCGDGALDVWLDGELQVGFIDDALWRDFSVGTHLLLGGEAAETAIGLQLWWTLDGAMFGIASGSEGSYAIK